MRAAASAPRPPAGKSSRRRFLQRSSLASVGSAWALQASGTGRAQGTPKAQVKLGVIGVGGRGTALLGTLLRLPEVQVPALGDLQPDAAARAQALVTQSGRPSPETYTRDALHYQALLSRADLDAVIIATPWEWHARMAVDAMKAGKGAGIEVPAALTLEECWDLVRTAEATGRPCMMLENWSFRRDNLAVLNMIRAGLLGDIVHAQCAYAHNAVLWFFDARGQPEWRAEHLARRNADQYPTHALGPVLSWLDIHRGDRFDYLTATATRGVGLRAQLGKKFGVDHPSVRRAYAQGDIVTTVLRTVKGNTVIVENDMMLPRPYDNRWLVQGTRGLYSHERQAVYLEGRSPQPNQWEPFAPYQAQYDHAWWKRLGGTAEAAGHGGTDYLELKLFVDALRAGTPAPLDVYDSVAMSMIVPLSAASIAQGSAPVKCPDFTAGRWERTQGRFAAEG